MSQVARLHKVDTSLGDISADRCVLRMVGDDHKSPHTTNGLDHHSVLRHAFHSHSSNFLQHQVRYTVGKGLDGTVLCKHEGNSVAYGHIGHHNCVGYSVGNVLARASCRKSTHTQAACHLHERSDNLDKARRPNFRHESVTLHWTSESIHGCISSERSLSSCCMTTQQPFDQSLPYRSCTRMSLCAIALQVALSEKYLHHGLGAMAQEHRDQHTR